MKKHLSEILISLRKITLIVIFPIMLITFSSCVSFIETLLGSSTCIQPGCDRDTSVKSSYCILHSDREPVEIDTRNPYKLLKPIENTDIKIKRKNY